MREPGTAEELSTYLDALDLEIRTHPAPDIVDRAGKALHYLDRLELSSYLRRNLRMRSEGVMGDAHVTLDNYAKAGSTYTEAMKLPAAPVERASLAIRTARYFAETLQWEEALAEANLAVAYFRKHRPRNETDLRSLTGALTARGSVALVAFLIGEDLPDLPGRAERDYRAALKSSSSKTEHCSIVAVTNLCNLAIRCWWADRKVPHVDPVGVAKEMKSVCKLMTKRGIPFRSRLHAKARWFHGLAVVEVYGALNREAERRLEGAFEDLLRLGAITDATEMAFDLGYCYLREQRWSDMLVVITTVLHHPRIASLSAPWREALNLLKDGAGQRNISQVIAGTYSTIRGFPVAWKEPPVVKIPRHRHADRSDTFGL